MKKNNGYKINFADSTITVNYKFAAAMNNTDSEEYKKYKEIMTDFPQFQLIVKSGRVQTKPRYNKRFTYANMEKYICTFDNAEELEQRFKLVQEKSKILASPYKYVCDWFKAQFPDYKEVPNTITKRERTIVLNAPDVDKYVKKAAQRGKFKMNNNNQGLFRCGIGSFCLRLPRDGILQPVCNATLIDLYKKFLYNIYRKSIKKNFKKKIKRRQ